MMRSLPVAFFSSGLRLDGDLYMPGTEPTGAGWPAVVACSGYQGLKSIHPARFARAITPFGYACLAFDYRGFGRSEGERGRLVPQEQVEDVRSGVSLLETLEEIDAGRIGLIGWALGGGIVIEEAADDPRVRAVVSVNGIGDGERATRFVHTNETWGNLLAKIADDRRARVLQSRSQLVDPFFVVRLDDVTKEYVDAELYRTNGFGVEVSLESAEALLRFRPEDSVHRIAPRPLLLVHGAENALHSPAEARSLYELAGEPKEIVLLEGLGHTEWMFDEHPNFRALIEIIRPFLDGSLKESTVPAALVGSESAP
jgi:pimeloyl-ACP methyl ester carboxylesterase